MDNLIGFIVLTAWMAGIVLSEGFWLCLASIFCPFYAWYLVIERLMQVSGLI